MARHAIESLVRPGWSSLLLLVLAAAVVGTITGCQQGSASTPPEASGAAKDKADSNDMNDPARLLAAMAETYKTAKTYEDAGVLQIAVESEDGQKHQGEPMLFSVALQRPSKIRVHSLEASLVTDGKRLYGSSDSLENQVLVQPCPEPLSIAKLFADKMLSASARAQLDIKQPQLQLLLDASPIDQLTGGGKPTLLPDAELGGVKCRRVSVKGPDGTTVLWISAADNLLLKFEFPSDELKKRFSVAGCSLWAEFKGARVNREISPDAFAFKVPEGARLLSRLFPPPPAAPSPLLGQKPENFTLVGSDGKSVTRESLEGKIAVLDMWATWCGWCFEGFPNLQKVYDQFQGNDKVVILAVNQDEPSVSDEQVRQSFEKKHLTIPIVRDPQQAGGKVLHVEGLPTMVVLGPDGAIEDYHVGYDAQLAETLPPKLKTLLDGGSLAKEELEKYEQARKAYDDELATAAVKDDAGDQ
jgi:outer membrane lipoprotein-sorting protein/thiol-disulfide isomerase/thioredoxin